MKIKKTLFKAIVSLNNKILPSFIHKDPAKLTKTEKAHLGLSLLDTEAF